MSEHLVTWYSDPICYRRGGNACGLISGSFHFRFADNGALQSAGPLTRMVLEAVLTGSLGPDKAAYALALGITPPLRALGHADTGPADAPVAAVVEEKGK